jgi:hypothetical protein
VTLILQDTTGTPFTFRAGQFFTLVTEIDGVSFRRFGRRPDPPAVRQSQRRRHHLRRRSLAELQTARPDRFAVQHALSSQAGRIDAAAPRDVTGAPLHLWP